MRIGFVTGEYPPMQGGVGAFTRVLAQTLAGMRHDVFVFSSVRAQTVFPGIHLTAGAKSWRPGSLRAVNRWASTHQLDVISLQFQTAAYNMSPFIHFLPRAVDRPVVTTFHDLRVPYLFPKAGPLREWIVMRLVRASAGVIATNHEDFARVDSLCSSALIPIGSNILTSLPERFDRVKWREIAGAGDHDLVVAHFGFINRSKGLETLLEAIAKLRADSVPIRLLMIGGRTGASDTSNIDYANSIDNRIDALCLNDCIHWTGYVDDEAVSAFLTSADVVVLPFLDGASYRRGSLMAAIQHRCAIVTTRPQVDIPAFVDGKNLRLIPSGDSEILAAALRELHESPEHRSQLMAGAKELDKCFDWGQIAQDTVNFFRQVTGVRN